ncbi:MAG: DUF2235 domain-containing protein [Rhodoferax sp.]|nr:DUF2235 domain-containing protein [Rhodoferax sp.]
MTESSILAVVTAILDAHELAETRACCDALAGAGRPSLVPGQFVYFAAFDGTNNDRANLPLSGAPLQTNVAELFEQVETQREGNPQLKAAYFAGVGTGAERGGFSARSSNPTPYLDKTVKAAYKDFAGEAMAWRDAHPDAQTHPLSVVVTGFSRGAGAAVAFARMLDARGFTQHGLTTSEPEKVRVAAMLLLDPVFTGIALDLTLPSNLDGPAVVVRARDEFRYAFPAANYGSDIRVQTVEVAGNHGNIGGFYDRGIGALVLQGATGFLRACGLLIGDVKGTRCFEPTQPVRIYNEGMDTYGNCIWKASGKRGESTRLTGEINQGPRW